MEISGALAFIAGVFLLYISSDSPTMFYSFLGLGIIAIAGAVFYTFGDNAYGYKGLGDISVFLFFGLLGVVGSYYLFANSFNLFVWLPAVTVGLFSTAVLNVNNIRDLENDQASGKITIPVRLGKSKAVVYHLLLLIFGWLSTVIYFCLTYEKVTDWLFLLITPLLVKNAITVRAEAGKSTLDPMLKQMVLTTLLYVILFSLSLLLR